ncbi:MAG: hypothetical protein V2B19_23570 [Pseudomonadota bacterium]
MKIFFLSCALSLGLLVSTAVSFGEPLRIEAVDGGVVDMGGVTQIIGNGDGLEVSAEGEHSEVRLDALTHALTPASSGAIRIEAGNGGKIVLNPDRTVLGSGVTLSIHENGVVSSGTLELGLGAVIEGKGSIEGHLENGGTVSPGVADSVAGRLTVSGDYIQKSTGRLEIDLIGNEPGGGYDLCAIGGDILVDGTIDVSGAQGFVPLPNSRFSILSASGQRSGTFSEAYGLNLPDAGLLTIAYEASSVDLVAAGFSPVDSDGDGLSDEWEMKYFGALVRDGNGDFDRDGISDRDEYLNGTDPTEAFVSLEIDLKPGYNLVSYPVEAAQDANTARKWMALIGDVNTISAIEQFNTVTGAMEIAAYDNAVDFLIQPGQAYVLRMKAAKTIRLEGESRCADLELFSGLNLAGYPRRLAVTTCFDWLKALGSANVSAIQRFNVETGGFETCAWCDVGAGPDQPCGIDFSITGTTGYQIYMKHHFTFGCGE